MDAFEAWLEHLFDRGPGLGHWHYAAPDEVSRIARRWVQGHPQAPDELRDYAVEASAGRVQ